jgi:serine/threonine protein kinase
MASNSHMYEDEDDIMEEEEDRGPPQAPVLVRYEVANNIFEVLEKYKLQYAIGQGAYGIVCSAFDESKHQKVAIKKVFKIFDHDREFQKRILREIKILKHFQHENVSTALFNVP